MRLTWSFDLPNAVGGDHIESGGGEPFGSVDLIVLYAVRLHNHHLDADIAIIGTPRVSARGGTEALIGPPGGGLNGRHLERRGCGGMLRKEARASERKNGRCFDGRM